jgi:hypothetical protein
MICILTLTNKVKQGPASEGERTNKKQDKRRIHPSLQTPHSFMYGTIPPDLIAKPTTTIISD